MKIRILFESEELIVVDKPVGLSVHNVEDQTNLLEVLKIQTGKTLLPVHRLDKETSGIQILAVHSPAASRWAAEFQSQRVQKIYRGVLRGQMADGEGVWQQSLSDKSEGRRNPAGHPKDQVNCETKFRVIKATAYFSHCEFDLVTGRQHQIRKHAALAGHPLVGDSRYGDPKYNQRMKSIYGFDRLFLHCLKIIIMEKTFIAALPDEFEKLG